MKRFLLDSNYLKKENCANNYSIDIRILEIEYFYLFFKIISYQDTFKREFLHAVKILLFGSISFAFIDVLIRFKEDNIIQLLYSKKEFPITIALIIPLKYIIFKKNDYYLLFPYYPTTF